MDNVSMTEIFYNSCAHGMIEKQVTQRGTSPAVVAWDETFSYAELGRLSDRLADHLSEHLRGPPAEKNHLVPILFEKSAWVVVAMLAVLKAGAGFVPLNPSHPKQRLLGLIRDVEADVVLTSASLCPQISELLTLSNGNAAANVKVLAVSRDGVGRIPISSSSSSSLEPKSETNFGESIAYAFFTSGSTGEPKGVLVENGSLACALATWGDLFNLGPGARVFQSINLTFDPCLVEIFGPLAHGGCVCIPNERDLYSEPGKALAELQATHLFCTPSYLGFLGSPQAALGGELGYHLKNVILGGEIVHQDVIKAWAPHVDLRIAYGPTECTVLCSVTARLDPFVDDLFSGLIGEPVPGCKFWIVDLDDHNKLVEEGEIGELLVEGRQVARGYLNDAAKTARHFIAPPTWAETQANSTQKRRFYATGDLVRRRTDTKNRALSLVMVGRKDNQLKLNGQRIEAGEIESRLRNKWSNDNLRWSVSVAVTTRSDTWGSKLVAFVGVDNDNDDNNGIDTLPPGILWDKPSLTQVRPHFSEADDFLKTVLPPYMVPFLYVPLSRLPVDPVRRKVDHKALAQLGEGLTADQIHALLLLKEADPSTEQRQEQSRLADLWTEILRLPHESRACISRKDSFFRLGGDSMMAFKLSAAADRKGMSLDTFAIIQHPVLEDMAREAELYGNESQSGANGIADSEPFNLITSNGQPLLEHPTQAAATSLIGIHGITPSLIQDIYPCVASQTYMAPSLLPSNNPSLWIERFVYELPSDTNLSRLLAALQSTVNNMAILRTRIIPTSTISGDDSNPDSSTGSFLQVVLKPNTSHEVVPIILTSPSTTLETYLEIDRNKSMSLGGEMCRFGIILPDDTDNEKASESAGTVGGGFLVWTMHHTIYDAFSAQLVMRIVDYHYFGGLTTAGGKNTKKKPAIVPYSVFVKRAVTTSQSTQKETELFWKRYLSDITSAPSRNSYPRLHPSPSLHPSGKKPRNNLVITRKLPPPVNTISSSPAGRRGSCEFLPSTLCRAALALSLSHISSSPISISEKRSHHSTSTIDVEQVSGPMISLVPMRTTAPDKRTTTVREFLKNIQTEYLERMRYSHLGVDAVGKVAARDAIMDKCKTMLHVYRADTIPGATTMPLGTKKEEQQEEEKSLFGRDRSEPNRTPYLPLMVNCCVGDGRVVEVSCRFDGRYFDQDSAEAFVSVFGRVLDGLGSCQKGDAGNEGGKQEDTVGDLLGRI
ncbi:hypothetical protein QBC40DRAFT_234012 [Triangularia verruculosa]|uniref:Carrier domain-containing protein n=1 Tax=Triangularia verruculosa TaxID=2587418 RepID=A0AAN6X9L8_9PEZI|nr:hypothetical protein QBC40DRAFT_234012 [Triangularia verruculosa]